jgi:hypothetical protein
VKSIEVGMARVVVVAIVLAVAALAYVDAQSSAAGRVTALADLSAARERSKRATEVEAVMARTNLAGKLEAALGSAFGGIWFERSTAQVHVGVISSTSRREAETVAAQTGLAENVNEISVRSSWAQLLAAQGRWGHRLGDLFERGEVSTSVSPERNTVEVELGSAVPSSRRTALEHAAAVDSVAISIAAVPDSHLLLSPQGRCEEFKPGAAFCNPTIVAGVTIKSPKGAPVAEEYEEELEEYLEDEPEYEEYEEGKVRFPCTAGPAVVLKDRPKKEDATKTYVLTAGHCINEKKGGGGVGEKWDAYNKAGAELELGPAIAYLNPEGTDVGVIEVGAAWRVAKDPVPVTPAIAAWKLKAESDPFPVIKKTTPVLGATSCMSGQVSAIVCGEIVSTTKKIKAKGQGPIENLIEVKGVTVKKGDSGAPWFAKAQYEEKVPTGYVEGTHAGRNTGNGNGLFQSLDTSFAELKKIKGLELELLTQANEKRHGRLKGGSYPLTLHGSSTGAAKFTTEAGSIECKSSTYHAVVSGETSTLTVTPVYKECKLLGLAATVEMQGCTLVLHVAEKASADNYRAYMDISCPAGKSIQIISGTCKAEVKAQTERETVDLINDTGASPKKDITVRPTVAGITYTVTQDGAFCPFNGTGEKTKGEYTSSENVTLTGQSTVESTNKIDVEIVDG